MTQAFIPTEKNSLSVQTADAPKITMGSLFDGIGGFPLAAEMNGIVPVWASEVEKFPITVTQKHFPHMQHFGDITKLHGDKLPPVDLICGGFPCQDCLWPGGVVA